LYFFFFISFNVNAADKKEKATDAKAHKPNALSVSEGHSH
jgi:hypothetical protein